MEYLGEQLLTPNQPTSEVAWRLESYLLSFGFSISESDFQRPWGGFHRIGKEQIKRFIDLFFKQVDLNGQPLELLDPKIMAIAPNKRLSLQVHDKRGEYWSILTGPIGAFVKNAEFPEGVNHVLNTGDTLWIPPTSIHRLWGLENWGIVPEIWRHTNLEDLSSETDIIRLEDDFDRK